MFRCLVNFKDLDRSASGEGIFLLAGQPYEGRHGDHFLKLGMVRKEIDLLAEEAKASEDSAAKHLEAAKVAKEKAKAAKAKADKKIQ